MGLSKIYLRAVAKFAVIQSLTQELYHLLHKTHLLDKQAKQLNKLMVALEIFYTIVKPMDNNNKVSLFFIISYHLDKFIENQSSNCNTRMVYFLNKYNKEIK